MKLIKVLLYEEKKYDFSIWTEVDKPQFLEGIKLIKDKEEQNVRHN